MSVTDRFRALEDSVEQADKAKAERGFFYLPDLDYDVSAGVPPLCSSKQFDIVYQLFHRDSVDRLNEHTLGSTLEGHTLDVVLHDTAFDAERAVVHCAAAEHFNYCFWYRSLRPWGTAVPPRLRNALQLRLTGREAAGGDGLPWDAVHEVERLMTVEALTQPVCCGWLYLVWTGKVFDVLHFEHGLCPITSDLVPLLCLNLHESAFYFDYPQSIEGVTAYVKNFFKTCNWNYADMVYASVEN